MVPASNHPADVSAPAAAPWRTVLLIVGTFATLRLAYLAFGCPYTLVEDEAHYWEWSRRLEWSYYSKGPGVAWLIALGRAVLGESELGVRAAAPICGALGALMVAGLAWDISRARRVMICAAWAFQLAPLLQATSVLMTIDSPYGACWAAGCWAAWRAFSTGSWRAWAGLGAALGAGLLFKYTIVLLVPGLMLAWWGGRGNWARVRPGAIALALGLAAVGLMPILLWNARHDWATLRHLLGHLGAPGGDVAPATEAWRYQPRWTLEYLGIQIALLGPMLALAIAGALHALRDPDPRRRAGAWLSLGPAASVLLFYFAVSFRTAVEGNWPASAALSVIVLAALAIGREDPPSAARRWWRAAVIYGAVAGLAMLRLDWIPLNSVTRGVLNGVQGRLMGAREMGAHVARLRAELRAQTNLEPLIICQHYGRASVLAFYLPGRPTVHCASAVTGGRRTQYDMWPETDVVQLLPAATGRPALLVGGPAELWAPAFERVEMIPTPEGRLEGDRKRGRPAFFGYGFRGFSEKP